MTDYLTFEHDKQRHAIALHQVKWLASTPNGASVEIVFGDHSGGVLIPVRVLRDDARVMSRPDAIAFVAGGAIDTRPSAEQYREGCASVPAIVEPRNGCRLCCGTVPVGKVMCHECAAIVDSLTPTTTGVQ